MRQYYFVGTSLPELKIGEEPEISFTEYEDLLLMNLSPSDYEKIRSLRLLFDLENLTFFLQEKPLSGYGNLNGVEFEETLLEGGHFPDWVDHFLEEYRDKKERLQAFPKLWAYFAQEYIPKAEGFLKKYFQLDRKIRLVMTALRAKQSGRDLSQQFIYEDPHDPLVKELLNGIYPSELVQLFQLHLDNPSGLRKALIDYRFKKIEEERGLDEFSIDRLLAYLIQLYLVERK